MSTVRSISDTRSISTRLKWETAIEALGASPPDELVEGWLERGTISTWFGPPNCGKTFLLIDLAAAISLGIEWMGRRTQPGLVVYLATEASGSVRRRLMAYQRHHNVQLPDLILVHSPIDLYSSDSDAQEVVQLVRQLERQMSKQCQLVIGETLACLAAGAKENTDDMATVMRHAKSISSATGSHMAIVGHSGKDGSKGLRGWSGIKAAVDTEIEVQLGASGGIMKSAKQRDLPRGELGFRLLRVEIGKNRWGNTVTSCVVEASGPVHRDAAPMKGLGSEIVSMLKTNPIPKKDIVQRFIALGAYKSNVYRELKRLLERGVLVEESSGAIRVALQSEKNLASGKETLGAI